MFKTSIKELAECLKKYVRRSYYILWAIEEARFRGSSNLEFFFTVKPMVSLVVELNIAKEEEVTVHGLKLYVTKEDIKLHGLSWEIIVKELRKNMEKADLYRESEDYIYLIIGMRKLGEIDKQVSEILNTLKKIGFKIGRDRIIGYDYLEG